MTHVALRFNERSEVAYALPLSVDGLLVVASVAMVDDKRNGRTPRLSARIAFAVGVTASVDANVAAPQPYWGARPDRPQHKAGPDAAIQAPAGPLTGKRGPDP